MTTPAAPAPTKRRIKRIEPLQLGKMLALLYGALGLIALPLILLAAFGSAKSTAVMAGGIGMAVVLPFLYALAGFVIGLLGALIYNAIAKWLGGIEVEVE